MPDTPAERAEPKRAEEQYFFRNGYLVATAHVARSGQESLAVEMLREIGITKAMDIRKEPSIERFDREPLIQAITGRRK